MHHVRPADCGKDCPRDGIEAVSARWLTWANRGLQGAVGAVTIAIGIMTLTETVFA